MRVWSVILLFLIWFNSYSQSIFPYFEKEIHYDTLKSNNIENNNKDHISYSLSNNDVDDVELHAVINPKDTNNIIVSWMSVDDLSNPSIQYNIYYTTNSGDTWQVGSINCLPPLDANQQIAGGGDPVLAFDNNGKAYFSWIYMRMSVIGTGSSATYKLDQYLFWATSIDNGATWQRESNGNDIIASGRFNYNINTNKIDGIDSGAPPDKQWMCIDKNTGDLYVTLTEFAGLDSLENTWGIRKLISGNVQFNNRVIIPDSLSLAATAGALDIDNNGVIHTVYASVPDTSQPYVDINHCITDAETNYSNTPTIVKSGVDIHNFSSSGLPNTSYSNVYKRLNANTYIAVDNSSSTYSGRIYVVWNENDPLNNYSNPVDMDIDIYLT